MKKFLFSLVGSILAISLYAQCDAPIVESWSAPSVDSITVHFTPPPGAQSYTLVISGDYGMSDFGISAPLILTGSVTSGFNTVNFDASNVVSSSGGQLANYYYSASLSVTCANGDSSAVNHFYVSAFSLLNDPGYYTGDLFFKPMTLLPDVNGVPFDTYISVPAADSPQEIDSISVFIDLGHTWNGDLSIELISPLGTSIFLIAYPSQLYGSMGFSAIFKDGYPIPENTLGNDGPGPHGIFSPSEPLSALAGQNPEGVWIVRVTDNLGIDDGMLFGVGLIINSTTCISTLSGKVFYDLNANAVQDDGELGLTNSVIHTSLDDQDVLSNGSGHFVDCSSSGSGTLSLNNTPNYYTANAVSFSVSDGEFLTDLDIPVQPIPGNNDLKVDLFATGFDRPGFPNTYILSYQNIGTECIDNVNIHINMDSLLLITDCQNNDVPFSGNSADLNLAQLCPLESGTFSFTTFLNDTVSIGTELVSTATISPVANDQNSADNVSEYHSIVVASFDPNDKTVSVNTINPSIVESGSPLKYMVRFQNTGNYYAERVLIVDTLDANLDPNSFVVSSTSHDVNVTRNGNIFYFEYANIFLPDSNTSEADSHGYIRYEVKPYVGMADGETINNTANIFFDFNPPIVTNTVTTVMDFSSGLSETAFEAKVYPNPAHNQINLEWLPDVRVSHINLLDLTGKKIKSYTVSGTIRAEINVEKLPAGAYVFQFLGADAIKPVVWMKY